MSKVDWSLAPEGATHYNQNNEMFYLLKGGIYHFYASDDVGLLVGGSPSDYDLSTFVERIKVKPWSGPEDGLPPVNTICEYRLEPSNQWHECEIRYHIKNANDEDSRAVVWNEHLGFDQVSGSNWRFRPIRTPAQIAAEKRETAIRELMDIAQVDCRVTAARLVDAGFKR